MCCVYGGYVYSRYSAEPYSDDRSDMRRDRFSAEPFSEHTSMNRGGRGGRGGDMYRGRGDGYGRGGRGGLNRRWTSERQTNTTGNDNNTSTISWAVSEIQTRVLCTSSFMYIHNFSFFQTIYSLTKWWFENQRLLYFFSTLTLIGY